MDEPRRHVPRRQPRGARDDVAEQLHRRVGFRLFAVQLAQRVFDEAAHVRLVAMIGEPLKRANANVSMTEPHQHRRAGGRRLVPAIERLAGLDQRQRPTGGHAERFEHFGREDFAYPALERQPAVAEPAPWRLPRTLGAEVH